MFCYKCGAKLDDDAKFCRHCGTEVNVLIDNSSKKISGESEKKKRKKGLILGLVAAVILIVLSAIALGENQNFLGSLDLGEGVSETKTEGLIVDTPTEDGDDAAQENEQTEKEDVVIKKIHMSTENMRPAILETSTIKVRVNKFSYANNKTVFGVNFIVENDTNENISVVLTDVKVNGYDVSTSTGKTLVESGHKANCDSSIWQENIDKTGELEWDVIEGVVEIRKDYWDDTLYSVPVIIEKACWEYEEEYADKNPNVLIASSDLAEIPHGSIVISSENLYPVLVEEDGVVAAVSSYGYANGKTVFEINFSMENNTDEDLSIVLTDVIVDGYDISTSTSKSLVEAGHKAICDSSVWLRDMKEVGINDWSVLTGTVEIRQGYWGDAVYSIPVVIYRNAWTSTN